MSWPQRAPTSADHDSSALAMWSLGRLWSIRVGSPSSDAAPRYPLSHRACAPVVFRWPEKPSHHSVSVSTTSARRLESALRAPSTDRQNAAEWLGATAEFAPGGPPEPSIPAGISRSCACMGQSRSYTLPPGRSVGKAGPASSMNSSW